LSGLSLVGSALIAQPGPQWNEMAIGNFSGAGRNDILWQANDGALAVWQMDGTQIAAGAQIGNLGTAWHVVGVADFAGVSASAAVPQNGDDAILLQNDDGALSLWQMDGLAVASEVALPDPGPDWQVVGVGDLDGNGRQDIVLEDGGGDVAVWGMQGSTIVASAIIANVGQNWHVAAIADVNGDGRDDILWQSNQGATAEWELNGLAIQSSAVLGDPGPSWHLKGAGPEIAGTVDLVWQQDGGNTAMWQVVSGTLSQGAVLANPGLTWQTLGSDEMRFVQPNSAVLTAAIGPNEFMFAGAATGSYTIQAFDPMIDVIAVPGSVFPGFASLETRLTAGPTGAMLNLGAATITITGVSIGALQPRNFLFE